jgi:hypothetical protein
VHHPSFSEVEKVLRYDSTSGKFFWKVQRGRCRAGEEAGTPSHGYSKIKVLNTLHYAHRLAWLLHYGEWPRFEIDHINMDRGDNRISNLREATHSQNQMNRKARGGAVGLKGVRVKDGKYFSVINVNGRPTYLGQRPTPELCHEAYVEAAKKLHGEFWRP